VYYATKKSRLGLGRFGQGEPYGSMPMPPAPPPVPPPIPVNLVFGPRPLPSGPTAPTALPYPVIGLVSPGVPRPIVPTPAPVPVLPVGTTYASELAVAAAQARQQQEELERLRAYQPLPMPPIPGAPILKSPEEIQAQIDTWKAVLQTSPSYQPEFPGVAATIKQTQQMGPSYTMPTSPSDITRELVQREIRSLEQQKTTAQIQPFVSEIERLRSRVTTPEAERRRIEEARAAQAREDAARAAEYARVERQQEVEFQRLRSQSAAARVIGPYVAPPTTAYQRRGQVDIGAIIAAVAPEEKLPEYVRDLTGTEKRDLINAYLKGGKWQAGITFGFIQAKRAMLLPGETLNKIFEAGKGLVRPKAQQVADAALADMDKAAAWVKAKIRMVTDPTQFREALRSEIQAQAQAGKLPIDPELLNLTTGKDIQDLAPNSPAMRKLKEMEALIDAKIGKRMGSSVKEWINFFTGGNLTRIEKDLANKYAGIVVSNYLTMKAPRAAAATPTAQQKAEAMISIANAMNQAIEEGARRTADAIAARTPGVGPEIRTQIATEKQAEKQAQLQFLQQQLAQAQRASSFGPEGDYEKQLRITALQNQIRSLQSQLRR